ncbi:MAG: 30S ribosomal protein S12 methylthiotransferase RimO, partial [Clostridiales bacterium]|nr:30S ribosomal protein S12 methylthiotransferase RimO [Clostridiales bacterium]
MKTVGVVSLGCSKNRVDTEVLLGYLRDFGLLITKNASEADAIIINTCGFIEPAKEESINTILEMARYKSDRCKVLAVCGCLSERYFDELKAELPEVDVFWGVKNQAELAQKIARLLNVSIGEYKNSFRMLTTPPYSAYLRVSDGCSNRCAYCAIPLIRGDMRSVPIDDLVKEAYRLAENGVRELNIIAQDTSAYGMDLYGKPMLCELLNRLTKIDEIHWIRLLYLYPDTVTDELIETIVKNDKIVNYIDIPIQHINDDLLMKMNRRGNSDCIKRIICSLRNSSKEFIIRSSVIVGFPSESEEHIAELLEFLEQYPINRLGVFEYSQEEDTPASGFENQINEATKQKRYDLVMRLQAKISKRLNEQRIGSIVEVLVESVAGKTVVGRSYAEAPEVDGKIIVSIGEKAVAPGDFVNARLVAAKEYDMLGE